MSGDCKVMRGRVRTATRRLQESKMRWEVRRTRKEKPLE